MGQWVLINGTWYETLAMGAIFTVVSIARPYCLRPTRNRSIAHGHAPKSAAKCFPKCTKIVQSPILADAPRACRPKVRTLAALAANFSALGFHSFHFGRASQPYLPAANFRGGYPATFAWVAAARLTQGCTPNLRVLKPKLRKRWRR
jgi:hypothetical protein